MLLGASIPQPIISTKGPIIIPPLASGFPYITNITGDVVTLANNNTISGFNVGVDFGNGLSGIAISNLFADQNNFIANVANANGFFLLNPTGEVLISNSTFEAFTNTTGSGMGNAIYAEVDFGTTLDSFTVLGSNFSDLSDPGSEVAEPVSSPISVVERLLTGIFPIVPSQILQASASLPLSLMELLLIGEFLIVTSLTSAMLVLVSSLLWVVVRLPI